MIIWQHIGNLINKYGKQVIFKKLVSDTYSEETGLPERIYNTVTIWASIQPVKKKGAIGGEDEVFFNFDEDGNWEQGAFILISKSNFTTEIQDEVKDLTINGKNYGDAFIDRTQDWSDGNGLYKVKVILKSIYPTRESYIERNA